MPNNKILVASPDTERLLVLALKTLGCLALVKYITNIGHRDVIVQTPESTNKKKRMNFWN